MIMATQCPTCGSEFSADAVDGLCLKCLGRLAFFSQSEQPGYGGLLRLGDYDLLEEIARGGMGVVYRARQLSLNRIVALKVVLHGPFSSPEFVRRFRNEAEAAGTLRHPNIVAIYEVGEYNGHHFLSMEFVDGQNLADVVRQQPLPARRAAGYVKTIAEAVHHAHQRGVLHRDLKPSNILLDAFDQPHITDFGLAKMLDRDAELTTTGEVLGSPNHMPPEQAAGKFSQSTAQSDVYSLGSILYQLIAGRPPLQGGSLAELLVQVQTAEPIPPDRLNPGVPVDLQSICLKCLQKEPARRYASAQDLALDLGHFLEGKPVLARPVSSVEKGWRWCGRRPLLASLSGALVITVILGIAGITREWRLALSHAQGEAEQRLIAEQDAAKLRLNLYAADLAVASPVVAERQPPGLARSTLDGLRPQPGELDLRGFEVALPWVHHCQGDQLATLKGHQATVDCVAFSRDGKRLASGGQDGQVKIWNSAKAELIKTLRVDSDAVWSLAFTPDGKYLMTGSVNIVQFWDADSWQMWTNFPGELAVLSRTGTFLATAASSPFYYEAASGVKFWNWRTGELLRSFDQSARALALSSDGSRLAIAGTNNVIEIWDTASGKAVREYPTKNPVWSLNFSPDDRQLLSTGWSSEASLWNLAGQSAPQIISGHQLHVWSAVYSADGATIATTSSDQTVRLWDATTLKPKSVLLGHENEAWCAAFSPEEPCWPPAAKTRM